MAIPNYCECTTTARRSRASIPSRKFGEGEAQCIAITNQGLVRLLLSLMQPFGEVGKADVTTIGDCGGWTVSDEWEKHANSRRHVTWTFQPHQHLASRVALTTKLTLTPPLRSPPDRTHFYPTASTLR